MVAGGGDETAEPFCSRFWPESERHHHSVEAAEEAEEPLVIRHEGMLEAHCWCRAEKILARLAGAEKRASVARGAKRELR